MSQNVTLGPLTSLPQEKKMKKVSILATAVLLFGVLQASAAGLITKAQAEKDALKAVGGGTVIQAQLDSAPNGTRIWSVDIQGSAHEYEVWVNAHTGAVMKIITQPPSMAGLLISKSQAEQAALNAVGGGTVLQVLRETEMGRKIFSVDISQSAAEYEVWVDAHTATVLQITSQPLAATGCHFLTKAAAEKVALNAIGGGAVIAARLETKDTPVIWSVDVRNHSGSEYEVQVNACTGKIVAIIVGG